MLPAPRAGAGGRRRRGGAHAAADRRRATRLPPTARAASPPGSRRSTRSPATEPALWIVEDVHWAGGDLLAFLAFAGEARGRAARAGDVAAVLLETRGRVVRGRRAVRARVAARAARRRARPRPRRRRAARGARRPRSPTRSDGNPLFIEELLRTWISLGTLVPRRRRHVARWRGRPTRSRCRRPCSPSTPRSSTTCRRRRATSPGELGCGPALPVRRARPARDPDAATGVELLARRALLVRARSPTSCSGRATPTATRSCATPATRASPGRPGASPRRLAAGSNEAAGEPARRSPS